jgi:hypothetical protein
MRRALKKLFGVSSSDSAPTVEYLFDISQQFRALKNAQVLNYAQNGRSISELLVSKARQTTPDSLIVVAHNEHGLLRFPNGSSIRVDALYKALGNRVGIILSCDTIHSEIPPNNVLLGARFPRYCARPEVRRTTTFNKSLNVALGVYLLSSAKAFPRALVVLRDG